MPLAAPEADSLPSGCRKIYLFALLLLVSAQTLLHLIVQAHDPGTSWLTAVLHLWLLASCAIILTVVISRLPRRLRGYPFAAPAAAMLLAGAHTIMSIFDVAQLLMRHYAGMAAPVWIMFFDPGLALSLLASMGISPELLAALLLGAFAIHFLLYLPVASALASAARAAMTIRVRLPAGRIVASSWLAIVMVAILAGLSLTVPYGQWRREWFHSGSVGSFKIAPAELMTSADAPPPPVGPRQRLANARPLILIVVDAMRRDRIGVYDPRFDNTPFLSGMAKAGMLHVFGSSYSTCTFSACGIMSVLSSRSWDSFGKRPPTVFDALSRYGYRGYAILAGHHTDMGKLTRLYGRVDVLREQKLNERHDDAWLVRTLREVDFPDPSHSVLYLHMISTHAGSFVFPRFRAPGTSVATDFTPTPDSYSRRYDGRVRQADYFLSQVFATLREKHLLDHALVIVTADHGERLGEHGTFFHGGPPDFAVTAVPLLVYDADGTTFPPRALASTIDVAPTLLRAVGGEAGSGWRGQALQEPARFDAVPIGTFETTGVIAVLDGHQYKYSCDRESGSERVARLDRPDAEGTPLPPGAGVASLLDRLRALHRAIAAPPHDSACWH